MTEPLLTCPECGSERVTTEHHQTRFMTLRERIAYWLLGNTTEIRP